MNISTDDLIDLFEYIGSKIDPPGTLSGRHCDGSLKWTELWLMKHGRSDEIDTWCALCRGDCDCKMLMNGCTLIPGLEDE